MAWSPTITLSSTLVVGHQLPIVPFAAGVRQGCPLAPFLYLFATQVLLSWLQHCDVEIRLLPDTSVATAVQFADDNEVVLNGLEAVPLSL